MEPYEAAAFGLDGIAFIGEPFLDRGNIRFARTEAPLKLARLKPSMVIGRGGILLLGEELVELGAVAQRQADLHRELAGGIDRADRGIPVCFHWVIGGP